MITHEHTLLLLLALNYQSYSLGIFILISYDLTLINLNLGLRRSTPLWASSWTMSWRRNVKWSKTFRGSWRRIRRTSMILSMNSTRFVIFSGRVWLDYKMSWINLSEDNDVDGEVWRWNYKLKSRWCTGNVEKTNLLWFNVYLFKISLC